MARTSSKPAFDWDDKAAVRKLKKLSQQLSSQELARANAAALNRAGKKAGSVWRKESAKDVTAPHDRVAGAFKDQKATPARGYYEIQVSGGATLRIKDFTKVSQGKTGVSVQIWKRGTKTLIRGAFLVRQYQDNALIREGAARGPLKTLYGPSPKMLALTKQYKAQDAFDLVFRDRIAREINFRVSKASR
jgi:hypothetical protein